MTGEWMDFHESADKTGDRVARFVPFRVRRPDGMTASRP
jgi:hypothetical protein